MSIPLLGRWFMLVRLLPTQTAGMIVLSTVRRYKKLLKHLHAYPYEALFWGICVGGAAVFATQGLVLGYSIFTAMLLPWYTLLERASVESAYRIGSRGNLMTGRICIYVAALTAYSVTHLCIQHLPWWGVILSLGQPLYRPLSIAWPPAVLFSFFVWDTFQGVGSGPLIVRILKVLRKTLFLIFSLYPILLGTVAVQAAGAWVIELAGAAHYSIAWLGHVASLVLVLPLLCAWFGSWYTWAVHTWYEEYSYVV